MPVSWPPCSSTDGASHAVPESTSSPNHQHHKQAHKQSRGALFSTVYLTTVAVERREYTDWIADGAHSAASTANDKNTMGTELEADGGAAPAGVTDRFKTVFPCYLGYRSLCAPVFRVPEAESSWVAAIAAELRTYASNLEQARGVMGSGENVSGEMKTTLSADDRGLAGSDASPATEHTTQSDENAAGRLLARKDAQRVALLAQLTTELRDTSSFFFSSAGERLRDHRAPHSAEEHENEEEENAEDAVAAARHVCLQFTPPLSCVLRASLPFASLTRRPPLQFTAAPFVPQRCFTDAKVLCEAAREQRSRCVGLGGAPLCWWRWWCLTAEEKRGKQCVCPDYDPHGDEEEQQGGINGQCIGRATGTSVGEKDVAATLPRRGPGELVVRRRMNHLYPPGKASSRAAHCTEDAEAAVAAFSTTGIVRQWRTLQGALQQQRGGSVAAQERAALADTQWKVAEDELAVAHASAKDVVALFHVWNALRGDAAADANAQRQQHQGQQEQACKALLAAHPAFSCWWNGALARCASFFSSPHPHVPTTGAVPGPAVWRGSHQRWRAVSWLQWAAPRERLKLAPSEKAACIFMPVRKTDHSFPRHYSSSSSVCHASDSPSRAEHTEEEEEATQRRQPTLSEAQGPCAHARAIFAQGAHAEAEVCRRYAQQWEARESGGGGVAAARRVALAEANADGIWMRWLAQRSGRKRGRSLHSSDSDERDSAIGCRDATYAAVSPRSPHEHRGSVWAATETSGVGTHDGPPCHFGEEETDAHHQQQQRCSRHEAHRIIEEVSALCVRQHVVVRLREEVLGESPLNVVDESVSAVSEKAESSTAAVVAALAERRSLAELRRRRSQLRRHVATLLLPLSLMQPSKTRSASSYTAHTSLFTWMREWDRHTSLALLEQRLDVRREEKPSSVSDGDAATVTVCDACECTCEERREGETQVRAVVSAAAPLSRASEVRVADSRGTAPPKHGEAVTSADACRHFVRLFSVPQSTALTLRTVRVQPSKRAERRSERLWRQQSDTALRTSATTAVSSLLSTASVRRAVSGGTKDTSTASRGAERSDEGTKAGLEGTRRRLLDLLQNSCQSGFLGFTDGCPVGAAAIPAVSVDAPEMTKAEGVAEAGQCDKNGKVDQNDDRKEEGEDGGIMDGAVALFHSHWPLFTLCNVLREPLNRLLYGAAESAEENKKPEHLPSFGAFLCRSHHAHAAPGGHVVLRVTERQSEGRLRTRRHAFCRRLLTESRSGAEGDSRVQALEQTCGATTDSPQRLPSVLLRNDAVEVEACARQLLQQACVTDCAVSFRRYALRPGTAALRSSVHCYGVEDASECRHSSQDVAAAAAAVVFSDLSQCLCLRGVDCSVSFYQRLLHCALVDGMRRDEWLLHHTFWFEAVEQGGACTPPPSQRTTEASDAAVHNGNPRWDSAMDNAYQREQEGAAAVYWMDCAARREVRWCVDSSDEEGGSDGSSSECATSDGGPGGEDGERGVSGATDEKSCCCCHRRCRWFQHQHLEQRQSDESAVVDSVVPHSAPCKGQEEHVAEVRSVPAVIADDDGHTFRQRPSQSGASRRDSPNAVSARAALARAVAASARHLFLFVDLTAAPPPPPPPPYPGKRGAAEAEDDSPCAGVTSTAGVQFLAPSKDHCQGKRDVECDAGQEGLATAAAADRTFYGLLRQHAAQLLAGAFDSPHSIRPRADGHDSDDDDDDDVAGEKEAAVVSSRAMEQEVCALRRRRYTRHVFSSDCEVRFVTQHMRRRRQETRCVSCLVDRAAEAQALLKMRTQAERRLLRVPAGPLWCRQAVRRSVSYQRARTDGAVHYTLASYMLQDRLATLGTAALFREDDAFL